jgi:DNA modification methylase
MINNFTINKLYNEDCLFTMRRIHNEFIDLTITSPPYDNLRDYKGFIFDFENIAKELFRITKQGGVLVWVVGDATINGTETGTSFRQALYFKEIGFNLHDTMIYKKNSLTFPETNRYYPCFEYMFIFSKGKPKTTNLISDKINKQKGKNISGNTRNPDGSLKEMIGSKKGNKIKESGIRFNIWEYNTGTGHSTLDKYAFKHPAIFPEKLAEDHIRSWSNEGDLIYDPMAGSGTTIKMSIIHRRNWIASEISKEYCLIIEKRIELAKRRPSRFWVD